jgi:nucleoside-diphosphate-sugar epimerase
MEALHVVLGAGGGIGGALVAEAAAAGLRVRAVRRRPAIEPLGVEHVTTDVTDPEGLRRVMAGATVVYHAVQPDYADWSPFPAMTAAIADAAQAAGAKLVFADNLYTYGPIDGPIRETTPEHPTSSKGRLRLEMARDLLARHARGDLRVALGRASDYYGPGGRNSSIGDPVFGRVLAGKKPRWIGNPDVPHSEHFLGDIARGLLVLGARDEADGAAWHLPAAPALPGRTFASMVCRAAGRPEGLVPTSARMVRLGGIFDPTVRALHEVMYQWEAPFVIDASRFEATFGPSATTPHERAIEETLAWFARVERAAA